MPVAPSFNDLLAQGLAEAQTRRPDLLFTEGDVSVAQLHGGAAMGDALVRYFAQAFKATFIDGAEGDDLTALVNDHQGIVRSPATPSQAAVELTRPSTGGSEPAGTFPAGSTVATEFDANGEEIQFTTDVNVVWALGELGPKSVNATSVETGRTENVVAGAISRVIDQPVFDTTFLVTNPLKGGGGNDEETDAELRTRSRAFYSTLRRGTVASLEFGARQVASVRVATAVEDLGSGITSVRVTDSDGNSTAQMVADVVTELENWRCAGSIVTVTGGTQILVDMTMQLIVRAGYDVAASASVLQDAAVNRLSKLGVGETMYLDSVIGSVIAVAPDDIFEVTFTAITATPGGAQPISDLTAADSEIIRGGVMTITEAP